MYIYWEKNSVDVTSKQLNGFFFFYGKGKCSLTLGNQHEFRGLDVFLDSYTHALK